MVAARLQPPRSGGGAVKWKWLIQRMTRREADFAIGGRDNPYLLRWYVIPRNPLLNIYLHLFLRSDDDRALHDHPWLFNASLILDGQYVEHTIADGGIRQRSARRRGDLRIRWGKAPHRIELIRRDLSDKAWWLVPCWTLFITGPRVRAWGFHCPEQGWVHWRAFTAKGDRGAVGAGCDGGQA